LMVPWVFMLPEQDEHPFLMPPVKVPGFVIRTRDGHGDSNRYNVPSHKELHKQCMILLLKNTPDGVQYFLLFPVSTEVTLFF